MLVDPIGFRRLGAASIDGSPLVIVHPKLQALHGLWELLRGERPLPPRAGFAFDALKTWLGHIAIVEILREPTRFRVRLFGTDLVELAGRDYTGQTLDKCVPSEQVATVLDWYHECLARCTPIARAARYAAPSGDRFILEQLLLPCSSDQEAVDVIVGAAYLERTGELNAST